MKRDPFAAIADPTRRQILDTLSQQTLTMNQLADHFTDISRQAVSKQVKFLESSGLLKIEKIGRERYCSLYLEPLQEVSLWMNQLEHFWNSRLDRLDEFLNESADE